MANRCIRPSEIQEGDLLAFVEGVATFGVSRHVAACPACAAEVAALSQADGMIDAAHYRRECPDVETLLRYQSGLLTEAGADPLRQHIATCPDCRAELALLAIEEPPPVTAPAPGPAEASLWERLTESGRTLLEAILSPLTPSPALALRGESAPGILYQAGPFDILLAVVPPLAAEERRSVEGQVLERAGGVPLEAVVRLLRDGQEMARDDLDEFGYFSLGQVGTGRYSLQIDLPKASIRVEDVSV